MPDLPNPLSVACPTCGAPPGEPCSRDTEDDGDVHRSRQVLSGYTPPGI